MPFESTLACEITLEDAEGLPKPTKGEKFTADMIARRAVRIGIFDKHNNKFVFNISTIRGE